MKRNQFEGLKHISNKVRDIANENLIFEYIHSKARPNWLKLCSSMDLLDLSNENIELYYNKYFEEQDNSYLVICGIFQLLIIQQDSIRSMQKVLLSEEQNKLTNKKLIAIRDVRNMLTGHPITSNGEPTLFSIREMSYNYVKFFRLGQSNSTKKQSNSTKKISIPKLIEEQYVEIKKEIKKLLNGLYSLKKELQMKENTEFKKFKKNYLKGTRDFYGLLVKCYSSDTEIEFKNTILKHCKESMEKIYEQSKDCLKLNYDDSIKNLLEKIIFVLNKIIDKDLSNINKIELEVYLDCTLYYYKSLNQKIEKWKLNFENSIEEK